MSFPVDLMLEINTEPDKFRFYQAIFLGSVQLYALPVAGASLGVFDVPRVESNTGRTIIDPAPPAYVEFTINRVHQLCRIDWDEVPPAPVVFLRL